MRAEVAMLDASLILQLIAAILLPLRQRATLTAVGQDDVPQDDALQDVVAQEAARVLALLNPLPALTGSFPRSEHPSTRHLESAFASGDSATAALLATIRPVVFHLPWRYSYAKRSDARGLEDNMAFAEIIGPEAPYVSERVCLGLTLIGPNTFYPPHLHPAIELYYVVAGEATWTANGVSIRNPPGAFILHGSQVVHAMRTHQQPLLAVYTWSGDDIRTTSAYTKLGKA
jgi:mannose-6-phosphate isomerase-like protein (cupin superfamily)